MCRSSGLRLFFGRLGFSERETVALCGAHTLGRHASLLGVSRECLHVAPLTDACIETGVRLPFVAEDADVFSNSYFRSLLRWYARDLDGSAAFIPTDVVLVLDPRFRAVVQAFAADEDAFFAAFSSAYLRLVHLGFGRSGALLRA